LCQLLFQKKCILVHIETVSKYDFKPGLIGSIFMLYSLCNYCNWGEFIFFYLFAVKHLLEELIKRFCIYIALLFYEETIINFQSLRPMKRFSFYILSSHNIAWKNQMHTTNWEKHQKKKNLLGNWRLVEKRILKKKTVR
jgi:hypothetical protein